MFVVRLAVIYCHVPVPVNFVVVETAPPSWYNSKVIC